MDISAITWDEVLIVIGALLVVAAFVAKLTPTDKDDKVVDWLKNLFKKVQK